VSNGDEISLGITEAIRLTHIAQDRNSLSISINYPLAWTRKFFLERISKNIRLYRWAPSATPFCRTAAKPLKQLALPFWTAKISHTTDKLHLGQFCCYENMLMTTHQSILDKRAHSPLIS